MSRKRSDVRLIALAIEEAGSTVTGDVSLRLEDILYREMLAWPSFRRRNEGNRNIEVFARMERLGICITSDITRLIEEAQASA